MSSERQGKKGRRRGGSHSGARCWWREEGRETLMKVIKLPAVTGRMRKKGENSRRVERRLRGVRKEVLHF